MGMGICTLRMCIRISISSLHMCVSYVSTYAHPKTLQPALQSHVMYSLDEQLRHASRTLAPSTPHRTTWRHKLRTTRGEHACMTRVPKIVQTPIISRTRSFVPCSLTLPSPFALLPHTLLLPRTTPGQRENTCTSYKPPPPISPAPS